MNIILYLLNHIQYQHKQICWLLNFIWHFRIPRKSKKVKKKDHLKKDGLFLLTRKIEIAIIPNINERTKAFLFGG